MAIYDEKGRRVGRIVVVYNDFAVQEKTAAPSTMPQTIEPDPGYAYLAKVHLDAMPAAQQAAPAITVSADGLITAKAVQSAGYVQQGEMSSTQQLPLIGGTIFTPSEIPQLIIQPGTFVAGGIAIDAIPSDYIGSGVNIQRYYAGSTEPPPGILKEGDLWFRS